MAQRSPSSLSTDLKRQVIYASLLRSEGAAQELRARVIDRLVLVALLESSEDNPVKAGDIATAVTVGAAHVRVEAIQAAAKRLIDAGLVSETRVRFKAAYHLTARGRQTVETAAHDSGDLVDVVIARMTAGLPQEISSEQAGAIYRRFFCEAFARLGLEIAKTVTGRISREDLVRLPQLKTAFDAALQAQKLSPHVRESLEARCVDFLRSSHPYDERLKLYLTQSYFFAQLVGIDNRAFDPLAEHAFSGGVLYLDTNTILPRILNPDAATAFHEVLAIGRRFGVSLKITRATVREAERVAAQRRRQLTTIMEKGVPDELLSRTMDDFLTHFMERRGSLTLAQFFEPFENLAAYIEHDIEIPIEDVTEEDLLDTYKDGRERIASAIQEESELLRKDPKTQRTLDHDVAHLLHVEAQRGVNQKTWFLTNDRVLLQTASHLGEREGVPLCFSLTGFLHTVSPFISTSAGEHSLADVLSSMLSEQLGPTQSMYDIEELVVLADLHEDVMATGDEKLVQAIDLVRLRALQGHPFRAENAQRAALELKKFLASSTSERERVSVAERERLRGGIIERDEQIHGAKTEVTELRQDMNLLRTELARLAEDHRTKDTTIEELQRSMARNAQKGRLSRAIFATIVGLFIALMNTSIAGVLNVRFPALGSHWIGAVNAIRTIGLLTIAISWTLYLARAPWQLVYRTVAITVMLVCVYTCVPGIVDGWRSVLSSPFDIVSLVVCAVLAWRSSEERNGPRP